MKNQEVWNSYNFYTSEVTKHGRYLGFSGVAICWFFKTPEITFPNLILSSLIFLVVFFCLDITQYYVAAMRLKEWMQQKESEQEKVTGSIEGDYWPPKELDNPSFLLFKLKLLVLLLGFICIGLELALRMFSK